MSILGNRKDVIKSSNAPLVAEWTDNVIHIISGVGKGASEMWFRDVRSRYLETFKFNDDYTLEFKNNTAHTFNLCVVGKRVYISNFAYNCHSLEQSIKDMDNLHVLDVILPPVLDRLAIQGKVGTQVYPHVTKINDLQLLSTSEDDWKTYGNINHMFPNAKIHCLHTGVLPLKMVFPNCTKIAMYSNSIFDTNRVDSKYIFDENGEQLVYNMECMPTVVLANGDEVNVSNSLIKFLDNNRSVKDILFNNTLSHDRDCLFDCSKSAWARIINDYLLPYNMPKINNDYINNRAMEEVLKLICENSTLLDAFVSRDSWSSHDIYHGKYICSLDIDKMTEILEFMENLRQLYNRFAKRAHKKPLSREFISTYIKYITK